MVHLNNGIKCSHKAKLIYENFLYMDEYGDDYTEWIESAGEFDIE